MTTATEVGGDLLAARDDLALFARMVGFPLTAWQAASLRLESLFTVLVGARQVGKSRALALLAVWWAFRRPGQTVLIISAGEAGATRLLRQVREVLACPLLRGSLVDEQQGLVVLDNGSRIVAVPASERQVRGYSVDLLLVDEAAYVADDLLESAALPTITARVQTGARVVLASTAWEASGNFYRYAMLGESGSDPDVRTFRWRIADCPWVPASLVDRMRATMSPLRFQAEYLGEFLTGGEGFFSRDDLMAAVAPYALVAPAAARGGTVVMGLDWGNRRDSHAICMLGALDCFEMNPEPVLFVPWLETSQRRYREQVQVAASIAKATPRRGGFRGGATGGNSGVPVFVPGMDRGYDVALVLSERNGVGQPATESLEDLLGTERVLGVTTTQETKERAFSRLFDLLSADRLVLPDDPTLLRELAGLEATTTQNGGLTIKAAGTGHDDLAMALSFCALALDADLYPGPPSSPAGAHERDLRFLRTPSGIHVPDLPRPRWGGMGRSRSFLIAT